ncbi:SWIM zinc finger domain protein [Streptomyces sp. WM6372]|uniref:SWIM zinc finger family protein n=1 Tax=Streptomyces sp. WM6372 TaxID=1415555 RepID=UPI0006AF72B1|nr:SWIM zinc finger family protein [Streptomyces sp. WM6372]KOU25415.1 SWIM zinc finger domain protein [Streptomyces sp. WM6372]
MNAGPPQLPPVAPEVLAEAVENLTARLRKKLDAAIEGCAAGAARGDDGAVTFRFGEDALVTLRPGPDGAVTAADQATCTCLLAPRCLHRAAALGAAPLADPDLLAQPDPHPAPGAGAGTGAGSGPVSGPDAGVESSPESDADADPAGGPAGGSGAVPAPTAAPGSGPELGPDPAPELTAAQLGAAAALRRAAAEALAAGVTAGGAVVQAELLRAAHTARLAGLPRAEAAALRVVRGLRAARDRSGGHRLADLTGAFRELLHTAGLLASGTAGPALTGTARRAYRPGGSLRVYGLCREPVLSATGYGGVVTHLLAADGSHYSVSDVRPGGLARARGAGSASVALGGAALDHAGLARGGLRIAGATVSADGRLGAGRGVQATPLRGVPWTEEPAAALFARPAAEAVAAQLADRDADPDGAGTALLGCEVAVVGAAGEDLLVREVRADAPLLRLRAAHPHPELPHTANLRRIAAHPGLLIRVLGRPDLDRAATLRPLAVGPVPGAEYTLRLPEEWLGRADLGYDVLQGSHFPSGAATVPSAAEGPDVLADSPLWRVRRLLESGVAGGRRAVAEAARTAEPLTAYGPLRRAGFTAAAELAAALAAEADRRPRDPFGRLTNPSPDAYAHAWLAASIHLAAAERSLVAASWAWSQEVSL